MKKVLLGMLLTLSLFIITACGDSNPLLGKWDITDQDYKGLTIEFTKENSVLMGGKVGTYEMLEKNRVILRKLFSEDVVMVYAIKDDKLSLTASDGGAMEFKKAK